MASFWLPSLFLLNALTIVAPTASTTSPFPLPVSARQEIVSCNLDTDCISGCTCTGRGKKGCIRLATGANLLRKCRKCSTTSDCPGDRRGCSSASNRCGTCALKAVLAGVRACGTGKPADGSPGVAPDDNFNVYSCTTTSDCISGCICTEKTRRNFFFNRSFGTSSIGKCKQCFVASDCPGDSNGCDPTFKRCATCVLEGSVKSAKLCIPPGIAAASRSPTPTENIDPSTKAPAKNCDTTSDCISGCTCVGKGKARHCASRNITVSLWNRCKRCSTASDCPGDAQGCQSRINRCGTCALKAARTSAQSCNRITAPSRTAAPSPTASLPKECTASDDCRYGCSCSSDVGNFCVNEESLKSKLNNACETCNSDSDCSGSTCDKSLGKCKKCIEDARKEAAKSCHCISTAWLKERDLEWAAIRHGGVANVLCIPGLPCATTGHLLRECSEENQDCKLVSVQEVCRNRLDCIESTMAVSQLSHTYNWSTFRTDGKQGETKLELTSLSANPVATKWSPSRWAANFGDYLNRLGFGWITNAVARFPTQYESFLKCLPFSESS